MIDNTEPEFQGTNPPPDEIPEISDEEALEAVKDLED